MSVPAAHAVGARGAVSELPLPAICAVLIAVAAFAAQMRLPLNADAQWILNVAGRVLNGQHLYRDILEINPPLIIWLELPIVWLARETGASAAMIYRVAITLGALGLTALAFAFYVRLGKGARGGSAWAAVIVVAVFLTLPGGAFGQREQLITMLLLPYVVLQASRVEQTLVGRPLAAFAGVAAGIAISLKPYFIAVWLLLQVYRAISRRPFRVRIEAEDVALVVTGFAYVAAVVWFAPGFLALVRTFAGTYAGYTTMTRGRMLLETAAIIWFAVAVAAWQARKGDTRNALGSALILAAAGAIVAAVWQGKGWTYHFLPAVAFSVLLGALALAAPGRQPASRVQRLARLAAAALLIASWGPLIWSTGTQLSGAAPAAGDEAGVEARELRAAIGRESDARSILVLSSDMTGTLPWIGEQGLASRNSWSCLWLPAVVYHTRWNGNPRIAVRPAPEMPVAERTAYASVVRDLTIDPPDLLVVETRGKNERFTGYPGGFDHLAYYGADPRFAACLRQYRLDATPAGYLVYRHLAADSHAGSCA